MAVGLGVAITVSTAISATGSGASGPPAGDGDPHRRTDLIGRTIDPASIGHAGDEMVSAIIEFAGAAVPTLTERSPSVNPIALERAVLLGQQRAVNELTRVGVSVTGRITNVFSGATARVRARDLEAVAALPGVTRVQIARPVSRANALANAASGVPAAWQDLGLTGKGVTIGIIDDGIDYTHATFGGSGVPADYAANDRTIIEPGSFPTAKVVGGTDLVGDSYDPASDIDSAPVPDPDPMACGVHGTHVAGTAAGRGVVEPSGQTFPGPYDAATLAGVTFRVGPGSAPDALIRAYKIFGCQGGSDTAVLVRAIDRAVRDRVDVLNLSLGEDFGTGRSTDLAVRAVNRASTLGVTVVAAAGNASGSPYIVGSASTADRAISVAAVDAGPPTFNGVTVGTSPPITGVEANEVHITAPVTGPVKIAIPGCDSSEFGDAAGKILVVSVVDGCTDVVFGHLTGVLAVIVIADDYVAAGTLDVPMPWVSIRKADAAPLLAAGGAPLTLSPGAPVPNPGLGKFAPFSSGGPRRVDSVLKPDLTAPGVRVVSAARGTGSAGLELSGTSMASPHTAGIVALIAQAHPRWTPAQLKAALMSTADPAGVADFDPRRGGTGLISARRAVDTVGLITTIDGRHNLSFGFQALSGTFDRTRRFRITNTSNAPITYSLSLSFVGDRLGTGAAVTPSSVTVPARSSRTVGVRLRIDRTAVGGLPSSSAGDAGTLTTVQGVVVATPSTAGPGVYPLRIAFLLVPKGLSNVTSRLVRQSASAGTITLKNNGRHAGDVALYQWLAHDRTGDIRSSDVPDILDVGYTTTPFGDPAAGDRRIVFVFTTANGASTHSTQRFFVDIDVNSDGLAEFSAVTLDDGSGRLISLTLNVATSVIVDAWDVPAGFNGSAVQVITSANALPASGELDAWQASFSADWAEQPLTRFDLVSRPVRFQPRHQIVQFPSASATIPPAGTIALAYTADAGPPAATALGALLVEPDDRSGTRAAGGHRIPIR
jgi:subtilisin family serine protease